MGFGLEVWVVAVEPIDTTMGLQVCLIKNAPDTRSTHGPGWLLPQGGDQIVETPTRGGAVVRSGFTSGHRHHRETR